MEPFFIRQGTGLYTPEARREWIGRMADLAHADGAEFCRATVHDQRADKVLFEGWSAQPEDQGAARWLPDA